MILAEKFFRTGSRLSAVVHPAGFPARSSAGLDAAPATLPAMHPLSNSSPDAIAAWLRAHTPSDWAEEACEEQLRAECWALGTIKWCGDKLAKTLHSTDWASAEVRSARLAELERRREEAALPGVSVVVVGNTGAGKRVLPTNGMRACTAALIELRHEESEKAAPEYRGEVEFLSQAEWDKELTDLLDDLTPNDGPNEGRVAVSEAARGRTHALGTVKAVTAPDAKAFRRQLEAFMDSTSDLVNCRGRCAPDRFGRPQCFCGNYWPIVKQWRVLATGAVLVDAPGARTRRAPLSARRGLGEAGRVRRVGVHDDNSARDAVVKRKIKEADAVWIVSNIVRAVNDKTAKDLLGEHFRRQLLMDGQFGALAFACRSLKLPRDTTLRACAEARNAPRGGPPRPLSAHLGRSRLTLDSSPAEARNEYTAGRLRKDFHAGLRELAEQAGEADAAALTARFELPVFAVSSVDYQKLAGLRPGDGPPRVRSQEESGIPRLARHVRRQALVRRREISLRRCLGMRDLARSSLTLLECESRLPQATRDSLRAAYDQRAAEAQRRLKAACKAAEDAVRASFDTQVAPQLQQGAASAASEALSTAGAWGISVTQGGLHWATYKATTRRHGVFRLNMNEALTAPILKAVSVQWERAFLSGLQTTLDSLRDEVRAALDAFHASFTAALADASVPSAGLGAAPCDSLVSALAGVLSEVREAAQKQQRELSRGIEPIVQGRMLPGYDTATAEAGTGSHRRRVAILEQHVRAEAPKMFRAAADGAPSDCIISKLEEMRDGLGKTLEREVLQRTLSGLRSAYAPAWDEVGESTLQARRKLAPPCREVLIAANDAAADTIDLDDLPADDCSAMPDTEQPQGAAPVGGMPKSKSEVLFCSKPHHLYSDPTSFDGTDLSPIMLPNNGFMEVVDRFISIPAIPRTLGDIAAATETQPSK
ncbi:hypothetical protein EMIHUDRAFT_456065 [Emiliania huxleyi CCMP1516]|uniref:DUF7605 domain-containing protein n=2 Tax=Emiliania huxleyi TaxID=2903 RepID=A0A0D3K9N3_EMIH1|nr:hypothetical protein EMIHUDRAFT_456065 [Emiliania huxleyi CCMP1516]EOD32468.1 hypothetical protein EMIHUDRAFT_456065 [Emiliania huxleyi CCMP1516]|eukprot:XP_005784897.1 hypothetical protein EMIHUDRAFT_456065 [Emiliania huxleyi CCMP1516]